jgi:hypothetical protein
MPTNELPRGVATHPVIAGLDPAIHGRRGGEMDARVTPGHDKCENALFPSKAMKKTGKGSS